MKTTVYALSFTELSYICLSWTVGLAVGQESNLLIHFVLTLFYTRGSEIVVLYVMIPQPYRFSPCFLT
jgi:hypothetical protein